jgi:hypothetical protein
MTTNRAYLVRELKWALRLGRLAYSPSLRGVGLRLVAEGQEQSMWQPLGLGLFWRRKAKLVPTTRGDLDNV